MQQQKTSAELFGEFWKIYPRKKEIKRARTAWDKAIKSASPEEIISGAQRYAQETADKEPQYIKHPATWLNAGCWMDEPDRNPQKYDSVSAFLDRWNRNLN